MRVLTLETELVRESFNSSRNAIDLHIHGSQTTVGDGTADGTGEGESGVKGDARELLGGVGLDGLLDSIQLHGAGRR